MNELLQKHTIAEDLDWCLNAPSLLAEHPSLWQPDCLKNQPLVLSDAAVLKLAQARQGKLGRYFEALISFIFEQHPDFQILAENRVIHQHGKTLGELDLVLRNVQTDEIIHLELALKFYLQVPNCAAEHLGWIGSGLHDFLALKLARLYQHQLQLPHIAEQAQCWPSDLPKPDRHALWIPGRLYFKAGEPVAYSKQPFPDTPWRLNPNGYHSYWLDSQTLTGSQAKDYGEQLTKAEWLNANPTQGERYLHKELPAQFKRPEFAQPVYVLPKQWQTNAQQQIEHTFKLKN